MSVVTLKIERRFCDKLSKNRFIVLFSLHSYLILTLGITEEIDTRATEYWGSVTAL